MLARESCVSGTPSLTLNVTIASVRWWILTSLTLPTTTPAMRTWSPAVSSDALENTALYSVWEPSPNPPMITTSMPVTMTETTVKMPSLMAATVNAVSREFIRDRRPDRPCRTRPSTAGTGPAMS